LPMTLAISAIWRAAGRMSARLVMVVEYKSRMFVIAAVPRFYVT
jgi:hypothetical protein